MAHEKRRGIPYEIQKQIHQTGNRQASLIQNPITRMATKQQLEERIRELESRLREQAEKERILELSSDLFCIAGADGYFRYVNPAWERVLGYSEEELLSRPFLDFIHPDDHRKNDIEVCKLVQGRSTLDFENRYVHKDGSVRILSWTATPDKKQGIFFCVGRDVTESRKAAGALQESRNRLTQIIEHANEMYYMHDTAHRLTYISPSSIDIFGYTPDEMMVKWTALVTDHPMNREGLRITEKAIRTGKRQKPYLLEIVRKDGEKRIVEINESPIKDETGRVSGISGALRDVTEKVRIETELRKSEERFRAMVESTTDWIWEVDARGICTYSSPHSLTLTGYTPKELIGKKPYDLMEPDEAERLSRIFQRHVREKKPINNLENRIVHKKGHEVVIETNGRPIFDEKGHLLGYRGINRDVTQRKRAEEMIHKSLQEKEILLKEIHHRVKNNLQIIISLLNLQSYRIQDAKARQAFENSKQRVFSMALVHEKLYRSRDFTSIQFSDYVQTMTAEVMRSSAGASRIRLKVDVAPVQISIDLAIPFGLIINELMINSIKYAFSEERPDNEIRIDFKHSKTQYALTVADNGVGLPDDVYYQKSGSMGMQLVHVLTEQLHGSIDIKRNKGTQFTITIDKPE